MSDSRKKKRKKKSWSIYKLGLRTAVYTAILTSIVLFLVLWLAYGFVPKEAGTFAGLFTVLVFIVTYGVNFSLEYRRLETLERITKNIIRKRFMEYEDVTTTYHDEVDYLIKQAIKSSRTIER
ncbi:hypothetical protein GWN75_07795, partial [candidate division KSB1 bacterium]|nr:hypothetical protein [candidate division KSB1 bacterium]NIV69747.1 hypothetical protein [Phycisphaerae bacterium]NIS23787.1 hypothetical protein [candidate division KSB1 bacterium]NIU24437.1 hypothetical protein [candidate division KSB1 bacterium]NIU94310.1 hypothetical protein [candidate division KSB1 bacterium]